MKDINYSKVSRNKDKSDYSVVEKVIDKKTEYLFEKWQRSGFLKSVEGCISAGKEANVYFSPCGSASESGKDYAIKIYKVETMVFRDREQYIDGEHRFRKGKFYLKILKVFNEFRTLQNQSQKADQALGGKGVQKPKENGGAWSASAKSC
jgi:serine/threonine-protein kinase RIO1